MKNQLVALTVLILSSCGQPTEETTPIRKDITETVFASGSLKAKGSYFLTAQTTGYVTSLHLDLGELIEAGDTLLVIDNAENISNAKGADELLAIARNNASQDSPQFRQAQLNIDISEAQMEQDRKQKERYERLYENNSVSKLDYEKALLNYTSSVTNYETNVEQLQKLKSDANQQVISSLTSQEIYQSLKSKNYMKAFISGKVYQLLVEEGDYVRQGDVIAEIGSPDQFIAEVNIDESTIAEIAEGQAAVIQLNTLREKTFDGRVSTIEPSFDASSQSFICEIAFNENVDFKIVNTQLQANIVVSQEESALLIPRNFIDFGSFVQEKGKQEKTKVVTGFVSNEWVQVISGIQEDVTLVTTDVSSNKN